MPAQLDQIRTAYDRFATAWRTNDGATVADCFAEDGALINPFGERADGRAAIAAMYTEYFGGMLHGTSTAFRLASVREVGDAHAFTDGEQTIYAPDGSVVLTVHLAALLRRDGDDWRIVDGRPYTFATAPV
jgi:uncharacterized protein (TIGR02246 family)